MRPTLTDPRFVNDMPAAPTRLTFAAVDTRLIVAGFDHAIARVGALIGDGALEDLADRSIQRGDFGVVQ